MIYTVSSGTLNSTITYHPADDERTENGALYKPEVSSLHDLVFNSQLAQFVESDLMALSAQVPGSITVYHGP